MNSRPLRIVIACGGTGGHLFPGLAVAQTLKDRGHEILLLVSEKAIDAQALAAHPDFRSEKLPSVGLPAILSPAFIRFLGRTRESLAQCRQVYRKFEPDAVLGMGGFTSSAPLLAAYRAKIPTFIHESNSIPGKANKLAARFFTDHVLLGFEACRKHFPKSHCEVTGTPVRQDLGSPIPRGEALGRFDLDPAKRTLLVMGGSQGATGVNQLMFKVAPQLAGQDIQIIHLTGPKDDRLAAANYLRDGLPAYVSPFHHQMQEAYSAADLVISRAGASSLSELSQFGIAQILIPYPYAAENHQEMNANIYVDAGAAEMFLESNANADTLAARIQSLLGDDGARRAMAEKSQTLAPRDAAAKVADAIEKQTLAPTATQ